jgi:hypothetical protein
VALGGKFYDKFWKFQRILNIFSLRFQIFRFWQTIVLKSKNLKSWPENVQTSLKLPKLIIKYLNLCIGGVLSFEF